MGLTEVADHILPAADFPELRYDWSNLQGLCSFHHDSMKARMETMAREMGDLGLLVEWCSEYGKRPSRFQCVGK